MKKLYSLFLLLSIGCNYQKTEPTTNHDDFTVFNLIEPEEFIFYADSLKNIDGKNIHVDDVFRSTTVVLRFDERNCENCIKQEIEIIKNEGDVFNVIGIGTYSSMRALILASQKYDIHFPVYYLPFEESDLLLPDNLEKYGVPYWFVMGNEKRAKHVFFPSTSFPSVSSKYYAQIREKIHNNKNAPDIFNKNIADLGTIKHNTSTEVVFEYTNNMKSPLLITDVTTSCGCTVASWDQKPILENQVAKLVVRFNSDSIGSQIKTVMVYHNQSRHPIKLIIRAYVI